MSLPQVQNLREGYHCHKENLELSTSPNVLWDPPRDAALRYTVALGEYLLAM